MEIFVATQSLGFLVNSQTNELEHCELTNGKFGTADNATYIPITNIVERPSDDELNSLSQERRDEILALVGYPRVNTAIRLNKKLYVANLENHTMEEVELAYDLVLDKEMQVVTATTSNMAVFSKNIYVRKRKFDCTEESELQEGSYQPIGGLFADSSHITLKTQNFDLKDDMPAHGDVITYAGSQWMVDEVTKSYIYTPRKRQILHLALKALK